MQYIYIYMYIYIYYTHCIYIIYLYIYIQYMYTVYSIHQFSRALVHSLGFTPQAIPRRR